VRAIEPAACGYAVNPEDGVRIFYEMFGPRKAERTIVFSPAGVYAHSRVWKMQIPYFARHGFRVVAYDCRGSGKSDRPDAGYTPDLLSGDLLSILDRLEIDQAVLIGVTWAIRWMGPIAAHHPERVTHLVSVSSFPALHLTTALTDPVDTRSRMQPFFAEPDPGDPVDWLAADMRKRYREMVEAVALADFPEPHSTKPIEDLTEWSFEIDPEHLIASCVEMTEHDPNDYFSERRCPTLIIHGKSDPSVPVETGLRVHEAIPHSEMVVFEGSGHVPIARDPVKVNLMIHEFIGRERPKQRTWRRAMARATKRALFVSSPIGLGHSQRDVAIARELRILVPDLQIDWLAQHPVTRVLEANGERIHPLSDQLAGESSHIEAEMSGEHELNVFQALRNMDEILLNNFHVFLDAAYEGNYDLWIGDEAWEVDYYLHENPELKSAPFAWLTDFVGYLPMEGGPDGREAFVTADYNAEMIEQVARYPRIRDVSLYIGNPDDVVPDRFGPDLPLIREWVAAHFDFNGYIRYFDPERLGDRAQLRGRFGYRPDERVAVAAVGGTSVGSALLGRIIDAYPIAREALPELRLVVVCGPRIDPSSLPRVEGVEYLQYVHNLYEMFAAADIALVQGGLSTTMELVATGLPFLYFPLTNHFEQNRHVAHRLDNYGVPAAARVPYADADASAIADRLARLVGNPPCYRAVEPDGARRAAERIAGLL
jgi:pimeloyl-ACP methyl ester carboxylesterase/predicted glycosyltransferase